MIKDTGVIREPRGLSWQNWSATCKDAISGRRSYQAIVILALLAALSGALYLRLHSGSNFAHKTPPQTSPTRQMNLNDNTTTAPSYQTAATESSATSTAATAMTRTAATVATPIHKAVSCDYRAMATAKVTYSTGAAEENTYHTAQLTLLETTGTVTSLFGSDAAHTTIAKENTRHNLVLSSLQSTLQNSLTDAGCN